MSFAAGSDETSIVQELLKSVAVDARCRDWRHDCVARRRLDGAACDGPASSFRVGRKCPQPINSGGTLCTGVPPKAMCPSYACCWRTAPSLMAGPPRGRRLFTSPPRQAT